MQLLGNNLVLSTSLRNLTTTPMKTISTKPKKGMTLLELTVVILVLLALVSVLFVGGRAWKKGSDRAASTLKIRNVQQAMRAYVNFNESEVAREGIVVAKLFGPGNMIQEEFIYFYGPDLHPAGRDYFCIFPNPYAAPPIGTLYMRSTGGGKPVMNFLNSTIRTKPRSAIGNPLNLLLHNAPLFAGHFLLRKSSPRLLAY
jgi:prepilin-type N-terminal cleavage/methylation domain-containing protein